MCIVLMRWDTTILHSFTHFVYSYFISSPIAVEYCCIMQNFLIVKWLSCACIHVWMISKLFLHFTSWWNHGISGICACFYYRISCFFLSLNLLFFSMKFVHTTVDRPSFFLDSVWYCVVCGVLFSGKTI